MNWELPVCIIRKACGWAGRSVCMLLITHSSSAWLATSGKSSEIHCPLWPCWLKLQGEPSSLAPLSLATGDGLPVSAVSRGL